MIFFTNLRPAPADFIGVQPGFGDDFDSIDLFTLNEPVGEHPVCSTVARQTLESYGYYVPPRAELVKSLQKKMRARPGQTLAAVA